VKLASNQRLKSGGSAAKTKMTKSEFPNDERSPKAKMTKRPTSNALRHSSFVIRFYSFVIFS